MLVVALPGRSRALRASVLEVAGPVTEEPADDGQRCHRREQYLLHRPQYQPTCYLVYQHSDLQWVPGDHPDGLPVPREAKQRLEKRLHLQTRTDRGDKAYLFLFTRVPPCVRDSRRSDRLLARSEEQFLPSHAHAQPPRDYLSPLLLEAVDVLGNVGAWRCGVVEAQRSVVSIPGRLEDAEGV